MIINFYKFYITGKTFCLKNVSIVEKCQIRKIYRFRKIYRYLKFYFIGRVQRVHQVVMAEMDNYEPDFYTDKVREDAQKLMEEVTPIFTQRVAAVIDALDKDPPDEVDENEFIGELKI